MSPLIICILIFIVSLVLYGTNLIPMGVTALITMAALVFAGCLDAETALSGFGNTNTIVIVGMFVIAAGLNRTRFVDKLSSGIIKLAGGSFKGAWLGYIILSALLTSFLTSPIVAFAIVYPLCSSMCRECNISPSKVMFPLVVVCIGCVGVLPTGTTIILAGQLNGFLETYGFEGISVATTDYTLARLPMMIILILWAFFLGPKFAPEQPILPIAGIEDRNEKAGKHPLSPFSEIMGYMIFFVAVILLIFGGSFGIQAWQVCLVGALLEIICGVLTEKEAVAAIPVPIAAMYVGALAMGNALSATGAGDVVGKWLATFVGHTTNNYILGFLFFAIPFILTQFMLNQGVINIFLPICLLTCSALDANPVGPCILVAAGALTAFMTPMATPAIPMAMGAGGYDLRSLFRQGWGISAILTVTYVFYTMTVYPAF